MSLSIPYQGSSPSQASLSSDPQHVPVQDLALATPGQAWTRAVKAKRGPGPADKRVEAYRRVLALLHAFASFFDLCELMVDDAATGYDSLDAILAAKATSTILKHVGPLRVFCEWLTKSGAVPPFAEKVVWSFVHCVLKVPRTASSTLDTSLRALKWSYHALGLKIELTVFQSPRFCGLAWPRRPFRENALGIQPRH